MSTEFKRGNLANTLFKVAPLILLFLSVLNEIDLNYLEIFSLNFPFILIFYWSLRKSELLGYGYIFIKSSLFLRLLNLIILRTIC